MAKKCAVCGEKISNKNLSAEFDFYALGLHPEHDRIMCTDCYNLLVALKEGRASEADEQKIETYLQDRNDEELNKNVELLKEKGKKHIEEIQVKQAAQKEAGPLMITSGYHFEGYKITDYIDYIVYETTIRLNIFKGKTAGITAFLGSASESDSVHDKLTEARKSAMHGLKAEGADRGANAIIGVDIDCTMYGDSIIGAAAKGTAVVIEKQE
jgi:uncharacterized protein YbjQ (UPF0145 family)